MKFNVGAYLNYCYSSYIELSGIQKVVLTMAKSCEFVYKQIFNIDVFTYRKSMQKVCVNLRGSLSL